MKLKPMSKWALVFWIVLNIILSYQPDDIGLWEMHNSGVLSYSILWAILNPLYWTNRIYNLYLVIPQTLVMCAEYYLIRKGKMPQGIFILNQLTALEWRLLNVPQEITVTMFAPLGAIFPPLALLAPLQKFPWTLAPTHETTQALPCYTWDCWGLAHFIRYWVLVAWTILPVVYWLTKWIKRRSLPHKCSSCENCTCGTCADMCLYM